VTRHLLVLALLLAAGACREKAPPPTTPARPTTFAQVRDTPPPPVSRAQRESVLLQFDQLADRFGQSREDVIRALGQPLRLRTVATENPNAPVIDTVIYLDYPAIEFILRKDGGDHTEYRSNIRVIGSQLELPARLKIGETVRSGLANVLGQPDDTQLFGNTTILGFTTIQGYVLQFYVHADTLRRVRWVFEIG
jgi:hypothetical protein